jgi:hypothetical protein
MHYEPVAEVRAQAASTLAQLGHSDAVEPLIDALNDVIPVCKAASEALGKLANTHATQPLLERLRIDDNTLFLDLLGALGEIGHTATIVEGLREALHRKKLVPFIGPDSPPALTGLPDRVTVIQEIARYAGVEAKTSLAETALATMHGGRHTFTRSLRDTLDDQIREPGVMYQTLAKLQVPLWVSTVYDQLLASSLSANTFVMGSDTTYWQPDRPTVIKLMGSLDRPDSLLIIEQDYERLRESEGDRKLLVNYLRNELQNKVVLFLGCDPDSPDFHLLVQHILNRHLAGIAIQPFLLWHSETDTAYRWNEQTIKHISYDTLAFVQALGEA